MLEGSVPNSYDRINYAIALAIKNDVNPRKNTFANFLRALYRRKFQVSKRIEKQELDIIISAWYADRWSSLVLDSPYFNKEETDKWKKMNLKEH